MTVKEMIATHFDMTTPNYSYIVKPKGTDKTYYHGNGQTDYMFPEISGKEITSWLIDVRQKRIVMIVDKDEEFEKKRAKAWEELTRRN